MRVRSLEFRVKFNYRKRLLIIVGADPCVRPGNVCRDYRTIRFFRDKRTFNSAHKNTSEIIMFCSCPSGGHTGPPLH